jgi:hypothetical protein
MMQSVAKTVAEYLKGLPTDRREAIEAVRKVVLANLPKGYEECMNYGMIGYVVPHSIYPAGYHCDPSKALPVAGLASQKGHMSLYHMCVYGNSKMQTWVRDQWKAAGKKLDMGKSCIRFKSLDDLPLEAVGKLFARVSVKKYVALHEALLAENQKRKAARKTSRKE